MIRDDAQVSRSSYVSKDSVVKDSAVVRGARLEGQCVVAGTVRVYGGTFVNCYIGPPLTMTADKLPCPVVTGGHFENCFIAGPVEVAGRVNATDSDIQCLSVSGDAVIDRCRLYGNSEVFDSPTLEGVTLEGSAWVYGDAVLRGDFTVAGLSRIERGYWDRAPRSVDFGFVSVTEATGGALVDCRFRTFADWKTNIYRIARRRAFLVGELSRESVDAVLATISGWEVTA